MCKKVKSRKPLLYFLPDNMIIGTLCHREKEKCNRLNNITTAYFLGDYIYKKIKQQKKRTIT